MFLSPLPVFGFITGIVFPLSVFATQLSMDRSVARFKQLNELHDLAHPAVNDVEQSQDGFIWIATQGGIDRFDGKEIVHFTSNPKDPTSISSNFIWDLFVDSADRLWVASEGGFHLYHSKQGTFKNFQIDAISPAINRNIYRVIAEASNGEIWFGSQDAGITVLNPATFDIRSIMASEKTGLSSNKIRDIYFDNIGNVWVGTEGGGLNFKRHNQEKFEVFNTATVSSFPSNYIRSILSDQKGKIWVGTNDNGLFTFDSNRKEADSTLNQALIDAGCGITVRDIHQDSKGIIRLATDKGLCQWQEKTSSFLRYHHDNANQFSLISDNVNRLFQDSGGVIWVSTYQGISRWNANIKSFQHISNEYSEFSKLSSNVISAFASNDSDTLYVGTWGSGIDSLNLKTPEINKIQVTDEGLIQPFDQRIMSLFAAPDNTLFVGTFSDGLFRLTPDGQIIKQWKHDPKTPDSLSSNAVSSILMLDDGRVAVGLYGGGLNLIDENDKIVRFQYSASGESQLPSNRVSSLFQAKEFLWVSMHGGGISRLDLTSGKWLHLNQNRQLNAAIGTNNIYSVWVSHKDVWLATQDNGVVRLTPTTEFSQEYTVKHYNRQSGLESDVCYGVIEDKFGKIWTSHSKGVSQIDPDMDTIINFNRSHGLQGIDFNIGAYHQSQAGIFFGGSNGFNVIDPTSLPLNHVKPKLMLISALQNKTNVLDKIKRLHSNHFLELEFYEQYLELNFAITDYAAPDQHRFEYRWGGSGSVWQDMSNNSNILLAGLSVGEHQLYVRGYNIDGSWITEESIIDIHVSPPWYRTNFAYLAYAFLILGGFSHQRIQNKRVIHAKQLKQEELENIVKQKTAQIKEQLTEIERLSQIDPLTGAYNRRFLHGYLIEQVNRIKRFNSNNKDQTYIGFIMIDIDHFKSVNDSYGHDKGDTLLLQFVERLKSVCRNNDKIIRTGGEEFLIIIEAKNETELKQLSERLRLVVNNHPFELSEQLTINCTCSLGATIYEVDDAIPTLINKLLILPDMLMYGAKQHGRNIWITATANGKGLPVQFSKQIESWCEQDLHASQVNFNSSSNIERPDIVKLLLAQNGNNISQ